MCALLIGKLLATHQVGPQTKEVIEPPRATEESSAEEPNGSGEEAPRRPDPLANRPSLMPGRIRSSPDMALELRGALFARGASTIPPRARFSSCSALTPGCVAFSSHFQLRQVARSRCAFPRPFGTGLA